MVNILLHLTMHEIYMQISSLSASADMMPVFRKRKIKTSLPAFSIPSLFQKLTIWYEINLWKIQNAWKIHEFFV